MRVRDVSFACDAIHTLGQHPEQIFVTVSVSLRIPCDVECFDEFIADMLTLGKEFVVLDRELSLIQLSNNDNLRDDTLGVLDLLHEH